MLQVRLAACCTPVVDTALPRWYAGWLHQLLRRFGPRAPSVQSTVVAPLLHTHPHTRPAAKKTLCCAWLQVTAAHQASKALVCKVPQTLYLPGRNLVAAPELNNKGLMHDIMTGFEKISSGSLV